MRKLSLLFLILLLSVCLMACTGDNDDNNNSDDNTTLIEGMKQDVETDKIANPASDFEFKADFGEDEVTGGTIVAYLGTGTEVVIPSEINGEKVENIAEDAFSGKSITKVTIPSTVTLIANAFDDDITEVIINGSQYRFTKIWDWTGFPEDLKPEISIFGDFGFDKEYGIVYNYVGSEKNITIPSEIDGVTVNTIGGFFADDFDADSIIISEGITKIMKYAFLIELNSLTIPGSLETIEERAFIESFESITINGEQNRFNARWSDIGFPNKFNTSILEENGYHFNPLNGRILDYTGSETELTIPNNINNIAVTFIGSRAFESNQLTSVVIPNSVTKIGYDAFRYNQLTSVSIEGNATRFNDDWGSIGFDYEYMPEIVNTDGVLMYDNVVLDYIGVSTDVVIPNSITEIGSDAFSYNQLTSITIPNSVTEIGSDAFSFNQLTSVAIPNSVTEIGSDAFYGNQLTSVTIEGDATRFNGNWSSIGFPSELKPE